MFVHSLHQVKIAISPTSQIRKEKQWTDFDEILNKRQLRGNEELIRFWSDLTHCLDPAILSNVVHRQTDKP